MPTDDEVFERVVATGKRRRVRAVVAGGLLAAMVPVAVLVVAWTDGGRSQVTADAPERGTFDSGLVGRYWEVMDLRVDDQTWRPIGSGNSGYLRVDGNILGAQLCTGVRAHVTLTPSSMTVDHLEATGGYCYDDHQNSGQQLIEVLLRRIVHWTIDGQELTLDGPGVVAKLAEGPVDDFPSTTLVSVPPGSIDDRALEVCEAHPVEDDVRAITQPHVVAAYDSTVDDVVAWYQAVSGEPDERLGPPSPGVSYRLSPNDIRREYASDTDRYVAACWYQGYYMRSGPAGGDDKPMLSVLMVRPDGREWSLFGSANPPERPSKNPRFGVGG
jgi:heat shock protein HslJ